MQCGRRDYFGFHDDEDGWMLVLLSVDYCIFGGTFLPSLACLPPPTSIGECYRHGFVAVYLISNRGNFAFCRWIFKVVITWKRVDAYFAIYCCCVMIRGEIRWRGTLRQLFCKVSSANGITRHTSPSSGRVTAVYPWKWLALESINYNYDYELSKSEAQTLGWRFIYSWPFTNRDDGIQKNNSSCCT